MSYVLTIAGVTQSILSGSLSISDTANGRATFQCQVVSPDGSFTANLEDEVVLTESGTPIFGGLVDRPTKMGLGGTAGSLTGASATAATTTTVSAQDFNGYAERRYVNETLAAGTMKSQLQTLVTNYLAIYGITLDPAQVNGPTLPDQPLTYVRLDAVLNQIVALTASSGIPYLWRIDASKVLHVFQPGAFSAPFNITSFPDTDVYGDIQVELTHDNFANRIILVVPPVTELDRVETFTGDGVTTAFTLTYSVLSARGYVLNNGVVESYGDGVQFPILVTTQWTLDRSTNILTRVAGPPALGAVIQFQFDGTFNGSTVAQDPSALTDPWEQVVNLSSIPDGTTAAALAAGYLAVALEPLATVTYQTFSTGVAIGQAQTITQSSRGLSGEGLIVGITFQDVGSLILRTVTVVFDAAQTNLGRDWRDVYKLWAGQGASGGGGTSITPAGSGSAAPATGPGGVNKDVQYNDGGSFGGSDNFTFDKNTHCLVMGDLSTITATSPESCLALGYDCHVADS